MRAVEARVYVRDHEGFKARKLGDFVEAIVRGQSVGESRIFSRLLAQRSLVIELFRVLMLVCAVLGNLGRLVVFISQLRAAAQLERFVHAIFSRCRTYGVVVLFGDCYTCRLGKTKSASCEWDARE